MDASVASGTSCSSSIDELYDLKEELGSGEFATVHRAVERETGKEVAVKVIRLQRAAPEAASLEYELSSRLSQTASERRMRVPDAFPRTYGSFLSNAEFYLVMDYFRGGTLEEFLSRRPRRRLSEAEARTVMFRVLSGIADMHHLNVAHCDLKPANLMLAEPGNLGSLCIVDLGLASDLSKGRSLSNGCGTPDYFAPELVRACRWGTAFGRQVDLWSAGVVLYQCLTGELPFRGNTAGRLLRAILQNRVETSGPAWAGVSEPCKALLLKLLEKDPAKRIQARSAMKHPWFKPLRTRSWPKVLSFTKSLKLSLQ